MKLKVIADAEEEAAMSAPEPRLRMLTLTLTERCNLRCAYCHVPVENGRTMSRDTLDAAVDLLERHGTGDEATLSFYGGEPLLAQGGMCRAVLRARAGARGKRRLRVLTPTNGLLLKGEALAWAREERIDVAVSVDGDASATERCFPDGRSATAALLPLLPDVLALEPASRVLARMTVTPANVDGLADAVRELAGRGFRRIVYLPAFEETWDDAAVAAWGREHGRIGAWLAIAEREGTPVPALPTYRAVVDRLASGKRRRGCGAGAESAAVSTDGGLYPCYRLVFRGDDDACRLGDVRHGFTNGAALERFASFDPEDVEPEEGACASCAARDGCTHACPALGLELLGDPRRVPSVACRLARAQVQALRPFAAERRRARRAPSIGWAAAFVAAAVTGASVAAGCASQVETQGHGGGSGGASSTGTDTIGGGGLCSVQVDSGQGFDAGGGICPVELDSGQAFDAGGGGLCPVDVDSGQVFDAGGGGICKSVADASDAQSYGPGLC